MQKQTVRVTTGLALAALLSTPLATPPAQAQEEHREERWYQVELLIFSHEGVSGSEQWQATPTLAYPNAARFLVDPEQIDARSADHDGSSEVDEYGRQFLRLPPDTSLTEDTATTTDIPRQIPIDALDANEPLAAEPLPAEQLPPLTPTPFVTLPASALELKDKAAYMQRSGYYQTLFHETWVEPVADERNALPIVVDRSGDTQQWPRLQGSVKLHISRYLHLETNLWLNTSGDYLSGEWRMPPPPLGPVSLIIEEPEPLLEDSDYYITEPALDAPDTSGTLEELEQQPLDLGPVYPWRHAVLVNQKRRMRSTEVHYIDHPLLGIVIKLTPLDEEQLEQMAMAEAAAAQAP